MIAYHSLERLMETRKSRLAMAYLMASGLFPRFARMQGCPALAQFKHDGVSSSHLIFCDRHRAQAVPFLRPLPGCDFCRGAGAASAAMPRSASIDGAQCGGLEQNPQKCISMSDWRDKAVAYGAISWWSLVSGLLWARQSKGGCPRKTSDDSRLSPGQSHTKSSKRTEVE